MNTKTKKCLSCKPTAGIIASSTQRRPKWKRNKNLKTIFPNDKKPDLKNAKLFHPKDYNQTFHINLGEKFKKRYILYYASKHDKLINCKDIKSAEKAYGSFKNRGMAKTDKNGKAILKLKCPQVYQENNKVYLSHVHFIISNENNTDWINTLKTQNVVCSLNHEELIDVLSSNCGIVLNALPHEYYIKDRIPHTHNLDHNVVLNKVTGKEVINYIKSLVFHNNKLTKYLNRKNLSVLNIPLVTYCYDEQCTADIDLQQKLNKIGFKNVKVFPPGIKGWRKIIKKD
jgi:rhodanese-related sulfurtransferase